MKLFRRILPMVILPNMTTSFCVTRLDVSAGGLVEKRSNINSHNDDDVMELYKKVAEQDPEWYQEFVTDVLQDESLLPGSLLKQKESSSKKSREDIKLNAPPPQETSNKEDIHHIDGDGRFVIEEVKIDNDKDRSTVDETATDNDTITVNGTIDGRAVEISTREAHNSKPESDSSTFMEGGRKADRKNLAVEKVRKVEENNDDTERREFAGSNATEQIVVYRDLSTNRLMTKSILEVAKLGYDVQLDIPVLKADVMALIIENNMQKPARGIPSHWKVTRNQKNMPENSVQLVSVEEAEQMLKLETERKAHATVNQDKAKESTRPGQEGSKQQEVPDSKMRSRRLARETRMKQEQDSDTRGDPPPPPGPVWVDIDTFRGLLRRENEFRINILGNDWKDTVKMEGKWRLGLYKQWLWALSNGRDTGIMPTRLPPRSSSTTSPLTKGSSKRQVRRSETEEWRPILDPRNPPRYSSRRRDNARRRSTQNNRKSKDTGKNESSNQ